MCIPVIHTIAYAMLTLHGAIHKYNLWVMIFFPANRDRNTLLHTDEYANKFPIYAKTTT
jgi:hypothetical protein